MNLATHQLGAETSNLPPVVLLHGFTSSAAEDFIATGWGDSLAAAGRTALAIDLPGHGDSPAISSVSDALTTSVVEAIVTAITSAYPTGDIDFIGYSLGGRLGWEIPGALPRVRRVVLGGVSPLEPFGAVDREALQATLDGTPPAHPLVGMMAAMISAPGRDTASLANLIQGLASEPFAPAAGGPQVDTLLVAGTDDQMTQGIETLSQALPLAHLTHVPGDHRGALDSEEFRAASIEFLAR